MTARLEVDGAPCWVDLSVDDVDAALEFYAQIMGWTAGERSGPEFGGYAMWFADGIPVAGVGPIQGDYPPSWTVYLATSDIESTLTSVVDAGGQVMAPAMQIGPLGRMAVIADSAMAVCGLWEAGEFAGFARVGEPGWPAWFDVQSIDADASRAMLTALFGYATSVPDDETPVTDYQQLSLDGVAVIGSMGAIAVPVSFWMTYFMVADLDAAIARAGSAGGTLLNGPHPTPFGRIATFADPQGAVFSLVG